MRSARAHPGPIFVQTMARTAQQSSAGNIGRTRLLKAQFRNTAGSRPSTATMKTENVIETTAGPKARQ